MKIALKSKKASKFNLIQFFFYFRFVSNSNKGILVPFQLRHSIVDRMCNEMKSDFVTEQIENSALK